MTQWAKPVFFAAAIALSCLLPGNFPQGKLAAQDVKPAVVFTIASLDQQVNDILYVAEAVGEKEKAQAATGFVPLLFNGLDLKRPACVYVVLTSGEPEVVGCLPLANLKNLFKSVENQLGKPEDLGNGLYKFEKNGQSLFVLDKKDWGFVSNSQTSLQSCPADPLKLMGDLPKNNNLALQVNVRDIPEELRNMALSQIEQGMAAGLENAPEGADKEFNEQWSKLSMAQIKRLFKEIDALTIVWNIDPTEKMIHVDATLQPVPGTGMARQIALLKDCTSKFSGFMLPGASIVGLSSSTISPEDIADNRKMLDILRSRVNKELDNDAGLDANNRKSAKEIITEVFDVLNATVEGGQLDYGAALMLREKSVNFAGGLLLADGKKLEQSFAKLVQLAKNDPEFPDVKLNVGKHGDVNLHSITVNVPDDDVKQLFGDKLVVTLGTGPKSLYVAFGREGEALMKKGIDDSVTKAAQMHPPAQVNVYLAPILKFAASMDPTGNPILRQVADHVQNAGGNDEINIVTTAVQPGVRSRIQIKEGVLHLIGDAIKAAQSTGM